MKYIKKKKEYKPCYASLSYNYMFLNSIVCISCREIYAMSVIL